MRLKERYVESLVIVDNIFTYGDARPRHLRYSLLCTTEPRCLFNPTEIVTAKSVVAKALSVVSPYFGTQDIAFAHAA